MIGTKTEILKWLIDQPDKTYEVKDWHPKRSLTQNAYFHVLEADLAGALGATTREIHYELLRRYSVPFLGKDDKPITLVSRRDPEELPGYWILVRVATKGRKGYMRIKGSSDMDSKEFSRLLDGLISECKEVGVETLPAAEIERLRGYAK